MDQENGLYTIRNFKEGDEPEILALSEKAYRNYGGRTRETAKSWRWRCAERPDVEKQGIIIAIHKKTGNIAGYAVAGKSGNLWELAYDSEQDGRPIISMLLEEAAAYLEKSGASSITFNAPAQDKAVLDVCNGQGFALGSTPQMFLSILDLEELVALLAKDREKELKAKYEELLQLKTTKAPFWIKKAVQLKIDSTGTQIDAASEEPSITVEADYFTVSSLIFGDISPVKAFLQRRLKIAPARKIHTGLKLLSCLQVTPEWSHQLSEYG